MFPFPVLPFPTLPHPYTSLRLPISFFPFPFFFSSAPFLCLPFSFPSLFFPHGFQCAGQLQTLHLSLGGSEPRLIHASWAHLSQPLKRHLSRFSHFCRAHERDEQTGRHTGSPHYSMCSSRPHLAIAAIWPNNNNNNNNNVLVGDHLLRPTQPPFVCRTENEWLRGSGSALWLGR